MTTTDADGSEPSLAAVEAGLHPRFPTVTEREMLADMHREGRSLRAIGRALGRPASTVKRVIDARAVNGVYRPHRAQRVCPGTWRAAPRGRARTAHRAHPPADLEHVAQQLNSRPRKTLGWRTPAERLRDLLTTT
ncbi:hypothetical protein GCM10009546_16040 [Actinomadura livida]|uniref:IS30 family transposase n=1 Tax=Actinomadura livida TaxID=79909 RepID=A0A7W7IFR2_9ACTN|nr:IS30 family transposase [Actinomadura catellatispora]GGU32133.1 hypothetical protein GCM10010208_65890 [Actinomadura livida]